ncbi:hypothetical protein D9613_006519 [Agrocybe pediades]|uniref:Uncharacterized protein n=1 Tax=Agrocybe pediades TaxID=84607 RepID=A0A8H4VHL3_9AGAR|nr:hypothetical protein D9613_006519 [Agrocybe pediades]
MKMVYLPPEIWLHIIDFLGRDWTFYPRMLTVNTVFLDVALNRMWGEVNMNTGACGSDMQRTMHELKRLSDPFISKRLKILNIGFRHHDYELKPTTSTSQETNTTQEIPEAYYDFPKPYGQISSREVLHCIIRALPQFRNVEEICLDWRMPPSYDHEQNELLQSIWSQSTFVPNLRAIWLVGALKDHRAFIETLPKLPELENMGLVFRDNYHSESDIQDTSIFTSQILHYIETISPTLRFLCVRCHTCTDCSPFFENLPRLPNLRELILEAHFDWSVKDLSSISSCLERCSETMRTLNLEVRGPDDLQKPEELAKQVRVDDWFLELFTSKNPRLFKHVEDLTIKNIATTQRRADIVVAILRKTRETLRKLNISLDTSYRLFNSEELARVFDAAAKCRRLTVLRIYIDCFDRDILEMLTSKLPSLLTLSIGYARRHPIISGEPGPDGMVPPPADGPLKGWVYRDQWKLNDVCTWEHGSSLHIDNLRLSMA